MPRVDRPPADPRSISGGGASSAPLPVSSIQTAVTLAGAAQALQQVSAQAAGAILNPAGAAELLGPAGDDPAGTPGATTGPTGFRTPFREDGGTLYLIDQRRLPDALEEYPCRYAGEVAYAIREMIVRGAPAIGQVAAIGLAMSAEQQRNGMPYARRATLRGAAQALINARPTAVNLRWAVERVMARYEEVGDLSDDGAAIADAMRAEADAIVFEATTDHGRLAGFGLGGPAAARGAAGPHPDPLQHRAAGMRPVRDRARDRAGGPPRRATRSTSGSTRRGPTCRAPG